MANLQRSVLITGCSDGGLGAALAIAFRNAGLLVYATARNPAKMTKVAEAGCQTLVLDVTSKESIAACVSNIPSLDILVNNAGGGYSMPVMDLSIPEAKKLFDLNVWSCITVTQAFLPLLLASKGLIANHTSVGSVIGIPFQSAYNASKAAMSIFSDTMRLELSPFDVKVVEIKTGGAVSKFMDNKLLDTKQITLPLDSIYQPAKGTIESVLRGEWVGGRQSSAEDWATLVAKDLLKTQPPIATWRGLGAGSVRLLNLLPAGTLDSPMKKMTRLDEIERTIRQQRH